MKKFLSLIFFLGFIQSVSGQAPDWIWAKGMGGSGGYDSGASIAFDIHGNKYVAGKFWGTADFNPGVGVYNLIGAGANDAFVSKYDSSGNFIWAKKMGGIENDEANSIAVDDSGNVYTTGYFRATADFDPGVGTCNLVSSGEDDIFISKLDSSGNFVWVKAIGGIDYEKEYSMCIDSFSNIYVTGIFHYTVDFDPGVGIFNMSAVSFYPDCFILKLNHNGDFGWAKSFGSAGYGITVDIVGNVITTGTFGGVVDFDPGPGVYNLTSVGSGDGFISKLDNSGNFIWAKSIDGVPISIIHDVSGNIYSTGFFVNSGDFDTDSLSVFTLYADSALGYSDLYILKNDSNGNFIWAKSIGGPQPDRGISIALDHFGNIYTTGLFQDTVDFDPNSGIFNLYSNNSDIFISKLNASGNFIWAKDLYGTGNDFNLDIAIDALCNVYLTSSFQQATLTLGATTLINSNNTGSNTDIFFAKLSASTSPCISTSATINTSACDSYTSPSGNYTWTTSGTHMDTIPNAAGCDSVLTINLTINTVTASYTLYPDPDTLQLHHWFAIANVTGTSPIDYLWSWGDGATDVGATPSHTYSAAAFYAICLTVTDGAGCTTTYCDSSTFISKTEEERIIITINVVTQLPSGIAAVTATNNSISITPNPCTRCEITGAVTATDLMVTDILGRNQHATFSKSANGFYIHLPATATGIFLIRNIKTGEVIRFVKE